MHQDVNMGATMSCYELVCQTVFAIFDEVKTSCLSLTEEACLTDVSPDTLGVERSQSSHTHPSADNIE